MAQSEKESEGEKQTGRERKDLVPKEGEGIQKRSSKTEYCR